MKLEPLKVLLEEIGDKRYYSFDGKVYPSVTTVLAETKPERDRKGLDMWRRQVGYEEAERISAESRTWGKALHSAIEQYILDSTTSDIEGFDRWREWFDSQDFDRVPLLLESPVYHPDGYAGTLDCLLNNDGEVILLDWKTSKKPKDPRHITDYRLQCAAYASAVEHVYGVPVARGVVVIIPREGEVQSEDVDVELWYPAWYDRLHQYYWG